MKCYIIFFNGFYSIVDKHWILNRFSEREIQILISGNLTGFIDIQDLKNHYLLSGGFFSTSPCIIWFFEILNELNQQDLQLLLKLYQC